MSESLDSPFFFSFMIGFEGIKLLIQNHQGSKTGAQNWDAFLHKGSSFPCLTLRTIHSPSLVSANPLTFPLGFPGSGGKPIRTLPKGGKHQLFIYNLTSSACADVSQAQLLSASQQEDVNPTKRVVGDAPTVSWFFTHLRHN